MAYAKRFNGPRGYRHDPTGSGIFIHGGTCLMHGPNDAFRHTATPNRFSLTFPLLDGTADHPHLWPLRALHFPTFQRALKMAKRIRAKFKDLHHCPIYACTDMIQEKPWMGRHEIQLISPRIARRKAKAQPILLRAA